CTSSPRPSNTSSHNSPCLPSPLDVHTLYISHHPGRGRGMRRMTTAEARKGFAKVLHHAERGSPTIITNSGQEIAAVISMEQLDAVTDTMAAPLWEAIAAPRANIEPADLEGPDPWADVRDRSQGRDFSLE